MTIAEKTALLLVAVKYRELTRRDVDFKTAVRLTQIAEQLENEGGIKNG